MDVGLAVTQWREFGSFGSDQSRFPAVSSTYPIFICCRSDAFGSVGCVLPNEWFRLERFAGSIYLDCSIDFSGADLATFGICLHHPQSYGYFSLLDGVYRRMDWV